MHFALHAYEFFIMALKDDIISIFLFLSLLSMSHLFFFVYASFLSP